LGRGRGRGCDDCAELRDVGDDRGDRCRPVDAGQEGLHFRRTGVGC
jgi:hypothetical protein